MIGKIQAEFLVGCDQVHWNVVIFTDYYERSQ